MRLLPRPAATFILSEILPIRKGTVRGKGGFLHRVVIKGLFVVATGELASLRRQKAWGAYLMATLYQGVPGDGKLSSWHKGALAATPGSPAPEHSHGDKTYSG